VDPISTHFRYKPITVVMTHNFLDLDALSTSVVCSLCCKAVLSWWVKKDGRNATRLQAFDLPNAEALEK